MSFTPVMDTTMVDVVYSSRLLDILLRISDTISSVDVSIDDWSDELMF